MELAETLVNRIRASLDAKNPLDGEAMQSSDLRQLLVETVQRKQGQNILLNGPAVRLREPEAAVLSPGESAPIAAVAGDPRQPETTRANIWPTSSRN